MVFVARGIPTFFSILSKVQLKPVFFFSQGWLAVFILPSACSSSQGLTGLVGRFFSLTGAPQTKKQAVEILLVDFQHPWPKRASLNSQGPPRPKGLTIGPLAKQKKNNKGEKGKRGDETVAQPCSTSRLASTQPSSRSSTLRTSRICKGS